MPSDNTPDPRVTLARRTLLGAGLLGGAAALVSRQSAVLQTPVASPAASPAATPLASPVASPEPSIVFPGGSPLPDVPLDVIREQRPVESRQPVQGGDLRLFVASANLANFNVASFRQDVQVACSLYDPLVWLDEVTCEPKPCLAESWRWSNNGLRLAFTIRDGVRWHDGSDLTAEDVAFSFTVYQQDYDSAVSGFFALVTGIRSTDARTVEVEFSEVDGSFVFNAGNLAIISSRQYALAWNGWPLGERSLNGYDWTANPPIGTGPWRFASVVDHTLTLERNGDYWAGPPHADRLILVAEDDMTARIDAWKRDEIDLVWPIPAAETTNLLHEEGRLYTADSLRTMFAAYNFDNPTRIAPDLFASVDFRQALLLAMDREAYQQSLFGSLIDTSRAGSVTQPWARDERIVNPERNVNIARQRLDGLGWVDNDGDGIRETPAGDILALTAIVQDSAPQELIGILEQLDRDFREIGVSLSTEVLDPTTWSDRWVNLHDFDLIAYDLLTYGAFNEFDLYGSAWDIRVNTNGWNPGGYHNETVDAALAEWFGAWELRDMQVALYKLQRAVTDDPFGLFFGCPQDPVLVRPGVYGYQPNKIWQSWNTRTMWIDRSR